MTPRDFRVIVEARTEWRRRDQKFQDQLMANQTAHLMTMQGRIAEDPVQPDDCLTFVWNDDPPRPELTEDEIMERFDRNMESWTRATREKFNA